jgi:hypothetical protein
VDIGPRGAASRRTQVRRSSQGGFFVVVVAALLAAGCSQTADQAGAYFHRAERSMSGAVTRAADALGILQRPETETMYARTNVNVRTGPGTRYEAIGVPRGRPDGARRRAKERLVLDPLRLRPWMGEQRLSARRHAGDGSAASATAVEPRSRHRSAGRSRAHRRPNVGNRGANPGPPRSRRQPATSTGLRSCHGHERAVIVR